MRTILLGASLVMAAFVAHEAQGQDGAVAKFRGLGRYAQVTTGSLVVPAGTTTSGSVMTLKGNLDVYGNVDGAATAVLGHVRNEGGSILGVIKDVGATHNRSTVSFGGRPRTTIGSLVSSVTWLIVLLLVGTFVLFFLRDYLHRAVEVVTNETGRSLFTGVLGGLASIPALIALVIAMAITIIGVFFIPIGVAAFFIGLSGIAVLGFLAVAQVTGIAIARKTETETPAGQELQYLLTGILAFSALWIIAAVFTWFPVLGAILRMLAFSVTLVAVVTGFGAVILSWWRSRPKKNAVAV
jgi:hypothetical protein